MAKSKAVAEVAELPKDKEPGTYGVQRDHDLPWNETKVALFKGLKKLHAFGAANAKDATTVAAAAGFEGPKATTKVRHYSYHAKSAGLIGCGEVEGINGYGFWLTAKGQAIDPVAAFKKQEDDKKKAKEKKAAEQAKAKAAKAKEAAKAE